MSFVLGRLPLRLKTIFIDEYVAVYISTDLDNKINSLDTAGSHVFSEVGVIYVKSGDS